MLMTVRKTVKEDFAYIPACFGAIYILSFDENKNIFSLKLKEKEEYSVWAGKQHSYI